MKTNIATFMIISSQFFLEWKMLKNFLRKIKKHILCSIFFFFENRAFYEIMWKNIVEPERPQTKIWRMRCACWLPKATNTHSEYVILTAFPLQQWLHESAWMLRCRFNICLVSKIILAHQAANLWPLLWPPLSFPCYQFVGIWPHLKPNRLHIFHLPNSFLRSAGVTRFADSGFGSGEKVFHQGQTG